MLVIHEKAGGKARGGEFAGMGAGDGGDLYDVGGDNIPAANDFADQQTNIQPCKSAGFRRARSRHERRVENVNIDGQVNSPGEAADDPPDPCSARIGEHILGPENGDALVFHVIEFDY